MKNFALLAATLIVFAGCARNDTDDMTSAPDNRPDTAVGAPASRQTGSEMNSPSTNTTILDNSTLSSTNINPPATVPPENPTNTLNQPNSGPASQNPSTGY